MIGGSEVLPIKRKPLIVHKPLDQPATGLVLPKQVDTAIGIEIGCCNNIPARSHCPKFLPAYRKAILTEPFKTLAGIGVLPENIRCSILIEVDR